MTTDVRLRFREWVKKEGGAAAVARRLGCTRSFVYMLWSEQHYQQRPSEELAKTIEDLSGIPASEWKKLAPGVSRRRIRRPRHLRPRNRARYVIVLEDGQSLFGEFIEVDGVTDSGQRLLVGRFLPSGQAAASKDEAAA